MRCYGADKVVALQIKFEGYKVDCVSPSSFLTTQARLLLGQTCRIFECPYEELETDSRYDMVLFSESFQYVPLDKSLKQTARFLNDKGYMLISDFFKTDAQGKSIIGGGHKMNQFRQQMEQSPFELISDKDITEQTAPNIDLLNDTMSNVFAPLLNSSVDFMNGRYPLIVKLLRWKYRKKLDKMSDKYFGEGRNGENFKKFKTYHLFLWQKNSL